MKTLTPELLAQARKLHNDKPWHKLWRIQVDSTTSATTWAALVKHSAPVTFDGVTYYPFNVEDSGIGSNSNGNLPSTTLALQNVTRESARWASVGEGFKGRPVELRIVHSAHLDSATHAIEFLFTCDSITIGAEAISLQLESPPLFDIQVPQDRFTESRCPWVYKGPICRYNGSLPSCDHSLAGANGCQVHGEDEVANGLPALHPLLFGAFPGITSGVSR